MASSVLTEDALALIQYHFSGLSLKMGDTNPDSLPGRTVEQTRAAYDVLVAEGLMKLIDVSRDGTSPRYWLTLTAMERKSEWQKAVPPKPLAKN